MVGVGLSFFSFGNQARAGTILGTQESQSPTPKSLVPVCQVFSVCRPLPDTVDAHGSSCASWLCPLPLAPARSALLTCPQGLNLYLCALQPASVGMAPQGLRSDAWSTSKPGQRTAP